MARKFQGNCRCSSLQWVDGIVSLFIATLSAVKRHMILDGIRVEELHVTGPVPNDGGGATDLEGVDGTWIDPKLLTDGRKEDEE